MHLKFLPNLKHGCEKWLLLNKSCIVNIILVTSKNSDYHCWDDKNMTLKPLNGSNMVNLSSF